MTVQIVANFSGPTACCFGSTDEQDHPEVIATYTADRVGRVHGDGQLLCHMAQQGIGGARLYSR